MLRSEVRVAREWFCPGPLLLLALVVRFKIPEVNVRMVCIKVTNAEILV